MNSSTDILRQYALDVSNAVQALSDSHIRSPDLESLIDTVIEEYGHLETKIANAADDIDLLQSALLEQKTILEDQQNLIAKLNTLIGELQE